MLAIQCTAVLQNLALSYFLSLGIPALVPVPRTGVVVDSLTGDPVAGVRITVEELPDTVGNCTGAVTKSARTNAEGDFELKLGCAALVTFAKDGYHRVTLLWPDQLMPEGYCGCCPETRPVKLRPVPPKGPPKRGPGPRIEDREDGGPKIGGVSTARFALLSTGR